MTEHRQVPPEDVISAAEHQGADGKFRMPPRNDTGVVPPPELLKEFFEQKKLLRQPRPVDYAMDQVEKNLAKHQFTLVGAPTGTGKTTGLVENSALLHPDMPVHLLQPTRAAVVWNTATIAKELGSKPGKRAGYALVNEPPVINQGEKSQIRAWTVRSLINEIQRTGELPVGTIIVDEADERKTDSDILLFLVKEYLPFCPNTRIIITSATLPKEFGDYFKDFGPQGETQAASKVEVEASMFKVEERIVNLKAGQKKGLGEHHTDGAIRAMKELVDEFVSGTFTTPPLEPGGERIQVKDGTMAMILAGKEDIRSAVSALEAHTFRRNIKIIPIHSEIKAESMPDINAPTRPGELRIIVGTDIIRRSVTLPDCVALVDVMEKKRPKIENGIKQLQKIPITEAERIQGKGRLGRTTSGVYVMIHHDLQGKLLDHPKPEIVEAPSTETILLLASFGYDIRTADLISKPSVEETANGIELLQQLGALDSDGKITALGREISRFPADPEHAVALLSSEKYKVVPEVTILMAIMSKETKLKRIPFQDTKVIATTQEMSLVSRVSPAEVRKLQEELGDARFKYFYKRELDAKRPNSTPQPIPEAERQTSWRVESTCRSLLEADVFYLGNNEWGLSLDRHSAVADKRKIINKRWQELAVVTVESPEGEPKTLLDTKSDFVALVQLYRKYTSIVDSEVPEHLKKRQLEDLAEYYCISLKSLSEIDNGIEELIEVFRIADDVQETESGTVKEKRYRIGNSVFSLEDIRGGRVFDYDGMTKALASGFINNIGTYTSIGKNQMGYVASHGRGFAVNSQSVVSNTGAPIILFDYLSKAGNQDSTAVTTYKPSYAGFAAEVKQEWLREVMPQLLEITYPDKTSDGQDNKTGYYEKYSGRIMRVEEEKFNGVKIGTQAVPLVGPEAGDKFASIISQYVLGNYSGLKPEELPKSLNSIVQQIKYTRSLYERKGVRYDKLKFNSIVQKHIRSIVGEVSTKAAAELLDFALPDGSFESVTPPGFGSFTEFKQAVLKDFPDEVQIGEYTIPLNYAEGDSIDKGLKLSMTVPTGVIPDLYPEDFDDILYSQITIQGDHIFNIQCRRHELRGKLAEARVQFLRGSRSDRYYRITEPGRYPPITGFDKEIVSRTRPYSVTLPSWQDVQLPAPIIWDVKSGQTLEPFVTGYQTVETENGPETKWDIAWKGKDHSTLNNRSDQHYAALAKNSAVLTPEQRSTVEQEIDSLKGQVSDKKRELELLMGSSPLTQEQLTRLDISSISLGSYTTSEFYKVEDLIKKYYETPGTEAPLATRYCYQYLLQQIEGAIEAAGSKNGIFESETSAKINYDTLLEAEYQRCPFTGIELKPNTPVSISHEALLYFEPDNIIVKETRDSAGRVVARISANDYNPDNQEYKLILEVEGVDRFNDTPFTTETHEIPPPQELAIVKTLFTEQKKLYAWGTWLSSNDKIVFTTDPPVKDKTELHGTYLITKYGSTEALPTQGIVSTGAPYEDKDAKVQQGQIWIGTSRGSQYGSSANLTPYTEITHFEESLANYRSAKVQLEAVRGRPWTEPQDVYSVEARIAKVKAALEPLLKVRPAFKQPGARSETNSSPIPQPRETISEQIVVPAPSEDESPLAAQLSAALTGEVEKQRRIQDEELTPATEQRRIAAIQRTLASYETKVEQPQTPQLSMTQDLQGKNSVELQAELTSLLSERKARPRKTALIRAELIARNMDMIGQPGIEQDVLIPILQELRKAIDENESPKLREERVRLEGLYRKIDITNTVIKLEKDLDISRKITKVTKGNEFFRKIMPAVLEAHSKIPSATDSKALAEEVIAATGDIVQYAEVESVVSLFESILVTARERSVAETAKERIDLAVVLTKEIGSYVNTREDFEKLKNRFILLLETNKGAADFNLTKENGIAMVEESFEIFG